MEDDPNLHTWVDDGLLMVCSRCGACTLNKEVAPNALVVLTDTIPITISDFIALTRQAYESSDRYTCADALIVQVMKS
jgi:hypothetical protein